MRIWKVLVLLQSGWHKDLNGNEKISGTEALSGRMFHAAPVDEVQRVRGLPVVVGTSYGCSHIKPSDRNGLFRIKAFAEGTVFIVYKYDGSYRKPW